MVCPSPDRAGNSNHTGSRHSICHGFESRGNTAAVSDIHPFTGKMESFLDIGQCVTMLGEVSQKKTCGRTTGSVWLLQCSYAF